MASPSYDEEIPTGQIRPWTTFGDFNNIAFAISQLIGKVQTATPVRVESCTNDGGLSPVGFVDITPLVNQLDAAGNPEPHVTIFNVPYLRLQGGKNAVIIDPQKGDLGIAVFASRDISKVKATKDQANPGSFRQYSFADALYLGGLLNDTPTQYVQFAADAINIKSTGAIALEATNSITLTAPQITMVASTQVKADTPLFTCTGIIHADGNMTSGASITAATDVTAPQITGTTDVTFGSHNASTHIHTGGTISGKTGPVV